MAGEILRVRIDELLRMGFSKPTAQALAQSGNMAQFIVIDQDDINGILVTLEGYSGTERAGIQDAIEIAERLSITLSALDAATARLESLEASVISLAIDTKRLEARIEELESLRP